MPNLYCTSPFNWSEAHCAGEKMKLASRTITKKSHSQTPTKTNNRNSNQGPPRQPGTPRPGSQLHGPRKEQQKPEISRRNYSRHTRAHIEQPDSAPIYGSLFFSCVCLMASVARSVNCLGQKNRKKLYRSI